MPLTSPDATFAIPWARKSADGEGGASPTAGTLSATPAPCTSTIAASAAAPVSRSTENAERGGRPGVGSPDGTSPTISTPPASSAQTTSEGIPTAASAASARRRSPAEEEHEAERAQTRGQRSELDPARVEDELEGALRGAVALHLGAGQRRQLVEHDQDGDAEEEGLHDRVGDEPREAPEPEDAGGDLEAAGEDEQQRECSRAGLAREAGERFSRGERGGARRRDHHELGPGGETPGDRADHRRVEPLDRVDADEDACGHPVRDARDAHRQPRPGVSLRILATRQERPQPQAIGESQHQGGALVLPRGLRLAGLGGGGRDGPLTALEQFPPAQEQPCTLRRADAARLREAGSSTGREDEWSRLRPADSAVEGD